MVMPPDWMACPASSTTRATATSPMLCPAEKERVRKVFWRTPARRRASLSVSK